MRTKERLTLIAAAVACMTPLYAQNEPAADPIPAAELPDPDEPAIIPAPAAAAVEPAGEEAAPEDALIKEAADAAGINPEDAAEEEVPVAADPTDEAADIIDPDAGEVNPIFVDEQGFITLRQEAQVNDIFAYLAKQGQFGYLKNPRLDGAEYAVSGRIPPAPPLKQMEGIARYLNLELYRDEATNTIYALDQSQLGQLPSTEWTYQLRYLRPTDIDQIKSLIQPMLTPGTGIINFEPKTNTIVVIDTQKKISAVENLLARIDKAKGQIVIETKILRTNRASGRARGIDWSTSLGRPGVGSGVSLSLTNDLNSLFNLGEFQGQQIGGAGGDAGDGGAVGGGGQQQGVFGPAGQALQEINIDNGAGLVLSPIQFSSVLRALNDANAATQESNPTLITEDNEEAVLSIIDRVPIITQTQSTGLSAGLATEEVRYTIDESDPTIATDPTNTREIGVTVSVTPTLLPDNTIRMKLRPRSAQITEQVQGSVPGVTFPRVQESTISTISRVPNNHTLLLGGFYNLVETDVENKVPVLGDIPLINFLFKSESQSNEQTSLVFCVTPKSYDPANTRASDRAVNSARNNLGIRDIKDYTVEDEESDHSSKAQPVYEDSRYSGTPMNNPFSRRR